MNKKKVCRAKCDCGHYAKDHHASEGACKSCGCTWYHPNYQYCLKKHKIRLKVKEVSFFENLPEHLKNLKGGDILINNVGQCCVFIEYLPIDGLSFARCHTICDKEDTFTISQEYWERIAKSIQLSERVIKSFENMRNNVQKALAEQPKTITFRQAYEQVHGKEWDE